ncbi:velvet factor-domain-containing protein [Xylariaceae sp. FL0804]|nr:velvet factor-domain-containing protein [Xylariaceae sp. FL0804]
MLALQPDCSMSAIIPAQDARSDSHLSQPQPFSREHRITKAGRHLWYQLEVLQQPERARACGSGPKSSADRRPVDPPPVVILRVFEGENWEGAKDITFDYNVDFFCYASLEHARPIAHGRVQTPAATTPPVLTGFPVSGCCYLDRPDPAGYFLFPDLSVRHEGRYRLVFSLYELIKDEADQDADAPQFDPEGSGITLPGDACHRMDLKSMDFSVYSAKKFPGLTESTTLSRTVADQGCRVRIRRDVRMRRRETKEAAASEYNKNAEGEYSRRRRTPTPEGYRTRSLSNTSMERTVFPEQRRPSNTEYGAPPPPPPYQNGQPNTAVLNFGGPGGGPNFAQPFGPAHAANPHSTPVSPAQIAFPHNAKYPAPVSSPTYPSPAYSNYESSEPDTPRRSSATYAPIYAKPSSSSFDPRSSTSSTPSIGQMASLTKLFPSPVAEGAHAAIAPLKGPPCYPLQESRSTKRQADETFPTNQDGRIVQGNRPPPTDYNANHINPNVAQYVDRHGQYKTLPFPA